jgi:hypothetical protein
MARPPGFRYGARASTEVTRDTESARVGVRASTTRALVRIAGVAVTALLSTAVPSAAPAFAIDTEFDVRGSVYGFPGGYALTCQATWFNVLGSTLVVTQTTIIECYVPGPGGVAALTVTTPGSVAVTGTAAVGARSTNMVCARALFAYLDTPTGSLPTPGTYDTGVICR